MRIDRLNASNGGVTQTTVYVISDYTNAQSAGLRSLVASQSGLQQPMQPMCNMHYAGQKKGSKRLRAKRLIFNLKVP